jgi:putative ABC transport system substrate-binding protein
LACSGTPASPSGRANSGSRRPPPTRSAWICYRWRRESGALQPALQRAIAEHVQGLYLLDSIVLTSNPERVGAFAREHRLPMMSTNRSLAVAGGLIAYGVNRPAVYRGAATYVDKILKGANPAELPVERPTTFDLLINLKTAQALGLTIPQSVLQQATEIIQ